MSYEANRAKLQIVVATQQRGARGPGRHVHVDASRASAECGHLDDLDDPFDRQRAQRVRAQSGPP